MNGSRLFVDTNILLYFLKGEEEVIEILHDKQLVISFISELELLAFPGISDEEVKNIKAFLGCCTIVDINRQIKRSSILLRKKYGLKLPDAIIAATALQMNLPIITADKQFSKVEPIEVILYV